MGRNRRVSMLAASWLVINKTNAGGAGWRARLGERRHQAASSSNKCRGYGVA